MVFAPAGNEREAVYVYIYIDETKQTEKTKQYEKNEENNQNEKTD